MYKTLRVAETTLANLTEAVREYETAGEAIMSSLKEPGWDSYAHDRLLHAERLAATKVCAILSVILEVNR